MRTYKNNGLLNSVRYILLLFSSYSIEAPDLEAQTFPPGFSSVQLATGLIKPTVLACAPDGRIFIAEQSGSVKIIRDGLLLAAPFLQLSVNSLDERGLLGIAFDPDFTVNQYLYLYYTVPDASRNRISRFTGNGDVAAAGSEVVILDLDSLSFFQHHNGGGMQFHNGKLLISTGENGNGLHAQNLDTYFGKILRINPDGSAPDDNPFPSGSAQRRRIWSFGLRNPYNFDVQPGTGKVFVNDVGHSLWEEINDASMAGKNFGWPDAEGSNPSFTDPLFAYPHGSGDEKGCAITGGVFFNPPSTNYPSEYAGKYFFQDYCNGWINTLTFSGSTAIAKSFASGLGNSNLSLETGTDGNLYYVQYNSGSIFKIIYTEAPSVITQPASAVIIEGDTVSFSVTASGTLPLQYQWQKNKTDISGAINSSYTLATAARSDEGSYRVIISNAAGNVISKEALLIVHDEVVSSVDSQYQNEHFSIFPNPARKFLNVKIKGRKNDPIEIIVLDTHGKVINHLNLLAENGLNCITVDVHEANAGCYFVRVLRRNQRLCRTVMIR